MANVLTPEFRVSWPAVFKAQKNKFNGKEEYSVTALFPPGADLSKLKAAAKEALEETWGADQKKWPKPLKLPFRDQGEKVRTDEETGQEVLPAAHVKGATFMILKTYQRPGVVDESVQPIIDETAFYSGCYARATIRAFTYDTAGNRGVSFGLQNIQKTKDGEPLSGRSKAEDDFAPVAGTQTAAKSKSTGSGAAQSAEDMFA